MPEINAKKIVEKYADKLKKEKYPFSAIYLFGSYAQNKNNKWSDIDVAVVSDRLKRNWWKNEILLSHISLDVDPRIEPHGFTVKGFADDSDPMVYEIKRTGVRVV
jgi:predicted nucleotidyltransferase